MLVDHPTAGGFVRRRQGPGRVSDITIDQRLKRIRRLRAYQAEQHEEQLLLPLGQIAQRGDDAYEIVLTLTLFDRGRVRPRGLEVTARRGTPNLYQSLGAAAHGADVVAECRAGAPGPACAAEWTHHRSSTGSAGCTPEPGIAFASGWRRHGCAASPAKHSSFAYGALAVKRPSLRLLSSDLDLAICEKRPIIARISGKSKGTAVAKSTCATSERCIEGGGS